MTEPIIRTLLDPLLAKLPADQQTVLRETLALFPDAYQEGWLDALGHLSGQLVDDEHAGVALTEQRIVAALGASLAARGVVPDRWARA